MANTITAGNGTNNGLAVTSDATGALNILTGSGGGTAAISIDSSQNVTMAANLSVTGNTTVTGTLSATNGITGSLKSGTAVASTSGTSIDFTSLPTGIKRITVMFSGVSTNGTSVPIIQLGDSGGVETSGYLGSGSSIFAASACTAVLQTTGFGIGGGTAASVIFHGSIQITLLDATANTWCANGVLARSDTAATFNCSGAKSLSATLDRVRITTVGGTDTFDAGSINILYE
jgi:hypothetical protein